MNTSAAVAARVANVEQEARNRAEDLQWMAETGETLTGAARRLGISLETLERWCGRHGQMAVYRRLAAREALVPTYRPKASQRHRRAS